MFEIVLDEYLMILNSMANVHYKFEAQNGNKYVKVIQEYEGNSGSRSVHAFVDKRTGAVYKPASWKAPVKDSRYNLYTDMVILRKIADPYGGYLYKDVASKVVK